MTLTGFTIGDAFASKDASSSGSTPVVFDENTVFKTASVKSNGRSYSVYTGKQSDLTEGAFVLVNGKIQGDGTINASEIIIVKFDYR